MKRAYRSSITIAALAGVAVVGAATAYVRLGGYGRGPNPGATGRTPGDSGAPREGEAPAEPARATEVEADWRTHDWVRTAATAALTPAEDAEGGCDGIKDGKWGFHTGLDAEPWWQVDLGETRRIERVAIFNRCDAASRADRIAILVSTDGSAWRTVYVHSAPTFFGTSDGKPLAVALGGAAARYVRCTIPGPAYLHLDEVEVYAEGAPEVNIALRRPCTQSSLSQWSLRSPPAAHAVPAAEIVARGRKLAVELMGLVAEGNGGGAKDGSRLRVVAHELSVALDRAESGGLRELRAARWAMRRALLAHPLLSFDRILFVKRKPGSFNHMSDQHYGWWSRAGGGLCILTGFRSDRPVVQEIRTGLPLGSYVDPDLSYDGKRILFGYCRFYPDSAGRADKTAKMSIPEDAYYHLYEVNLDGTGLRRVTAGRYDDFSARYLPDDGIVFLSTRRGVGVQWAGDRPAQRGAAAPAVPIPGGGEAASDDGRPDSYVRCGGDRYRPVSVYTLHVLSKDRTAIRAISPFENFEWTPNVCSDGRILYARWDYVDRNNMPYMKLWTTNPDGTSPQALYGNYSSAPHCAFEARSIPGSRKLLFTASAHHAVTGGSLVLFDPSRGMDGPEAIRRLTPEVPFPEVESWPSSYFMSPYPLSETVFLTSWSAEGVANNPENGLGLYVGDVHGNLELVYRDPAISSMYAMPIRPRPRPPIVPSAATASEADASRVVVADIYSGLANVPRGSIRALRVVAVPAKVQPEMNTPNLGMTSDDPGKCVLGSVPVERDGSAHFNVPSGVPVFFQAIGSDGTAVQTMRTVTYGQPNKTLACVGCHEPRNRSRTAGRPMALQRPPSKLAPGPEGTWPYRYDKLVQPVLDARCVSCHRPGGSGARFDLRPEVSYGTLVGYGRPSLREHVQTRYYAGRSIVGQGAASTSPLLALLRKGHQGVQLRPDEIERLVTWMDTYAQRLGSFSAAQEAELIELRRRWAPLLRP